VAPQPLNNAIRVSIETLAAVLGGAQSIFTCAFDEPFQIPTESSAELALRTQQIIAYESGVSRTVDPLGGSYYVEWLTDKLEADAMKYIERIDQMGGMVAAVEQGYPQREIASSAYQFQRALESGERVMVGVNRFQMEESGSRVPLLRIDESVQREQSERLRRLRAERDEASVRQALEAVRAAARGTDNLMPPIIRAASLDATEQEICDVLRQQMGSHSDRTEF
jgi:methylmalonyl-CoA mutase N-terminal domain/subunit